MLIDRTLATMDLALRAATEHSAGATRAELEQSALVLRALAAVPARGP